MDVIGSAFIDIRARTANFDRQLTAATRTGMAGAAGAVKTGSKAIEAESAAVTRSMSSRFGAAAMTIDKKMTGAFRSMRHEVGAFLPSMKLALPAALIAAGVATVHMAGNFETATTQLVTGAGETQKALGGVRTGLLHMSTDVGASATDLAHGLYMIESAGFHGAKGLNVLQKSSEGAKVGAADMETVADAVTTALNAYDRPAADAAAVTNTLIETVKAGKTHLQDLAGSLGQVLPNAAALHIPFEQVAAAMATMTSQGTNANKASTSLRFLFNALVAPTSSAATMLKHFGLSSHEVGDMLTKKGLGPALSQIIDAVAKKFPVGSAQYVAAVSHMVGGTRGMTAALELTGKHADKFQGNVKTITDRVHHAGDQISGWDKIQQTFNQRLDVAKMQIEDLGIKIGNKLMPKVSEATVAFGNFADGLDGSTEHASAAGDAGIMVGRVWQEQVKPALVTVGNIIQSVTGFFSAHITVVKLAVAAYIGFKTAVIGLRVVESIAGGISRMSGAMASGSNAAGRLAGSTSAISARIAGGAGAGVAGGPVGIALAAALTIGTIAIGHFMHKSAEAKARVEGLRDSLNQETGAVTKNTKVFVANELQKNGAADAAQKLGLNLHDVELAALGNQGAIHRVNKELADLEKTHGHVEVDRLGHSIKSSAHDVAIFHRDVKDLRGGIGGLSDGIAEAQDKVSTQNALLGTSAHRINEANKAYKRGQTALHDWANTNKLTTTKFITDTNRIAPAAAKSVAGLIQAVDNGKAKAGPAAHRLAQTLLHNIPRDLLTDAGRALVDGLIAGVNAKTDAFVNSMTGLSAAGAAAFKRANESSSPSRLYRRLMGDNIAGMLLSIKERRQIVATAVATLGQEGLKEWGGKTGAHGGVFRAAAAVARNFAMSGAGVHSANESARSVDRLIAASQKRITQLQREKSDVDGSGKAAQRRRDAIEKEIRAEQDHITSLNGHKDAIGKDADAASKAADKAKAAWQKIVGVYREGIGQVNASLHSYIQARNSMRQSIASTLIDTASLTGFGTTAPGGIITGLSRQDRAIHAFSRDIGALRKRGLSRPLINQLSAAGLDAAPLVHRLALTATQNQIARINRLNTDIVTSARGFGQSVADATYGAKIDKTNDHLQELKHELGALTTEVKRLRGDTQAVGGDVGDVLNGVARHAHHRKKR